MNNAINKGTGVPVGLKRLVIWPLVEDSKDKLEYGDVHEFDKVLMTLQDDPTVSEGSLSADDVEVENLTIVDGGKVVLGVTMLTSGERVTLYGEVVSKGTNLTNINNLSGYVCVACMTRRSDGKYNLKKYFKTKFIPGSETNETVSKGGVKHATLQITGNYSSLINNGNSRAVRHGVDLEIDKEIVNQWFTEAAYFGPEETANANTTTTGDQGNDG